MDKLKMAHDYFMKHVNTDQYRHLDDEDLILWSFDYVDAMQAEADKRNKAEAEQKRKEIREMLSAPNTFVEREGQHFDDVYGCEVDWRVAPENAFQWQMINNEAYWRIEIMGGMDTEPAPSFGFTGTHIVERPHGL